MQARLNVTIYEIKQRSLNAYRYLKSKQRDLGTTSDPATQLKTYKCAQSFENKPNQFSRNLTDKQFYISACRQLYQINIILHSKYADFIKHSC